MISVNVRSSAPRKTIACDITSTPKQVFAEAGVDTSASMVSLDGAPLSAADFSKTFEELGVTDGTTVGLSAIVKADGANE